VPRLSGKSALFLTVRHPAAEKMEASAFRKKRSVLNSQASCCRKDGSLGFQEKSALFLTVRHPAAEKMEASAFPKNSPGLEVKRPYTANR